MGQFISEAVIISLLLVLLAIPGFNKLSGQEFSFDLFVKPSFWLSLAGLFIIGVFCSGLYPAFVLSNFKPVEVLKGKMSGTKQSGILRKSLVVFQFSASLFLLIGSLVVYRQIEFMRKQPLGIQIEQTLVVAGPTVGHDSTFLQRLQL